MKFLLRTALTAFAFAFVFPNIEGLSFTGSFFPDAVAYALMFAVFAWIVNVVARLATAVLAIGTFGLGLIVLVPMWIFGFWLLPAWGLMWLADFAPAHLTVAGWVPAAIGGLVMLFINLVTNNWSSSSSDSK